MLFAVPLLGETLDALTLGFGPHDMLKEQKNHMNGNRYHNTIRDLPHMQPYKDYPMPAHFKAPPDLCPLKVKHRMKLHYQILFDELPTMTRQSSWYPQVYSDALCKSCGMEVETEQHIRSCGVNVSLGVRTLHYTTFRKQFAQNVLLQEAEANLWLDDYGVPVPPMECNFLHYGIQKPEWAESAVRALRKTKKEAVKIWDDLINLTREQFLEVWKVRNAKQIEWEMENDITFRKKREMKAQGGRRNRIGRENPKTGRDYHREHLQEVNEDLRVGREIGRTHG